MAKPLKNKPLTNLSIEIMKKALITVKDNVFTLENQWIKRVINVDNSGVLTRSFTFENEELLQENRTEFMVAVNRKLITSFTKNIFREVDGMREEHRNELIFQDSVISEAPGNYQRLDLKFAYHEHFITLRYEIADSLPAMRKKLIFTAGSDNTMLETLIFDNTPLAFGSFGDCEYYVNMAKEPSKRGFTCSGNADFLRIYNPVQRKGYYLANTAPGVLRYFMTYLSWHDVAVGYNCESAPFRKYLNAGETFESHEALSCFYTGDADGGQDDFRKVVRSRLPELADPADVMYCSWIDLWTDISEEKICALADKAAACGFTFFVIDCGWFTNDDWAIDYEKFPNGMKKVSDYIHSLGLKFGLWFNIGNSYGMKSDIEKFAARMDDNSPKRLGFDYSTSETVQCFASGHRERMTQKLHELASDYNVDYFKMDFSNISSPYGILPWGCHAKDHAHHRDFSDSFINMYGGFDWMRSELKKLHPSLLLDFSFECFGPNDPSIGALACSEINHLSNYNSTKAQIEPIDKVRRDFYTQSAALPPERLMHGLPAMRNETAVEALLSSFCGMPLISGDLRNLDNAVQEKLHKLCTAYRNITKQGALTGFEELVLAEKVDAFRRFADDGREFICVFNKGSEDVEIPVLQGCKDVLTGNESSVVSAGSCAMLVK